MGKRLILIVILLLISSCASKVDEEYVIGSLIPLTGPAAEFGEYNKMACDLYVELYNKDPKNKKKIRHIYEDTKTNPKDGINAINAMLLRNKPLAILNELTSVSLAVAPVTDKEKIIMIAIAGSSKLTQEYDYTFRNYPDPVRLAEETIKAFFSNYNERSFAIVYANDEFGLGSRDTFTKKLEELGGRLLAEDSFDKSRLDFRSQLIKIINNNPEVVYLVGFGKPLGMLIKQIRELGYKGKLLGGPEAGFKDVRTVAGDAVDGLLYLDVSFDSTSPMVKEFIGEFKKKFNKEPSLVSAVVYDAWDMLMHAVEQAGTSEPEAVKKELLNIKEFMGITGKLSITKGRDISHTLVLKEIKK